MVGIAKSNSNSIDIQSKNLYKGKENNFFKDKLKEKLVTNSKGKIKDDGKGVNSKGVLEKENDVKSKVKPEEEKEEYIVEDEDIKEPLLEEEEKLMSILGALYQLLYEKNHLDNTEKFNRQINGDKKEQIYALTNKTFDNLLYQLTKMNEDDSDHLAKSKFLLENGDSVLIPQSAKEKLLKKIEIKINKQLPMDEETLNQKDLIKFISKELEKEIKNSAVSHKNTNAVEYLKSKMHVNLENGTPSKEENFLKKLIEHGEKSSETKKPDIKTTKLTNLEVLNNFNSINKNVSVEVKENITVTKANIVENMVKSIKYMENNNLKNLTVKVMPKELGEILIRLTMEAGKIKLALNATAKETYNLLNSNLGEISEKLSTANIKIQPSEINVYNDDTTFFSGQFMGDNPKEREEGREYNSNFSKGNVVGSDDEQIIAIDENYNGNLNAKV